MGGEVFQQSSIVIIICISYEEIDAGGRRALRLIISAASSPNLSFSCQIDVNVSLSSM